MGDYAKIRPQQAAAVLLRLAATREVDLTAAPAVTSRSGTYVPTGYDPIADGDDPA